MDLTDTVVTPSMQDLSNVGTTAGRRRLPDTVVTPFKCKRPGSERKQDGHGVADVWVGVDYDVFRSGNPIRLSRGWLWNPVYGQAARPLFCEDAICPDQHLVRCF